MRLLDIVVGLAVLSTTSARVIRNRDWLIDDGNQTRTTGSQGPRPIFKPRSILEKRSLLKRDDDPTDFGWIKKWAAIGDSFTAGIGAGTPLGSRWHDTEGAWSCSRYDRSYPMVLNRAFGGSVDDFQFVACSGDRTPGIYEQAKDMKGGLDLVVLTAGGNDLCLADLIKSCIFTPGKSDCDNVIEKAQENIDNILKDNMRDVLDALKDKVKEDGIVIYNGYAQYFNTKSEDCKNNQDWVLFSAKGASAEISIERRKQYNKLVQNINAAIKSVVEEYQEKSSIKYRIAFSNWDPWPYKGVSGQMCDPSSSGAYPDPDQSDLQFFKPDTRPTTELRRAAKRGQVLPTPSEADLASTLSWRALYKSVLYHSPNPRTVALSKLDKRVPSPAGCPSDGSLISLPVSDELGKNFHPNEKGHITVSSFVSAAIMDTRASILGEDAPSCEVHDQFTCWSDTGSKRYVSADLLDDEIDKFCDNLHVKKVGSTWLGSSTYYKGTPEEFDFAAEFRSRPPSSEMGKLKEECAEAVDRLIHGCDGSDDNPMNWKGGGQWRIGDNTWEVSPTKSNRPWPPPDEVHGKCEGWYKVFYSEYKISGGGWSTHDHGQKTLFNKADDCMGSDPSKWKFEYHDKPTDEGYEWKASFRTPIWVRARCYANNKVSFGAGGFTNGCKGND